LSSSTVKSFTAVLEPLRTGLGWVVARIPFDPVKAWLVRRGMRVRGEIEGFAFRTSLFASAPGGGHFLLVNKKMQAAARIKVGSLARIRLEPASVRPFFGQGLSAAVQDQARQESLAVSAGLKRQDAGLLDELIVRYQHRLMRYLLYLDRQPRDGRGPVPGGLDAGAGARRAVQRQGAV
jgi:hypothetical protein